MTLKMILELSGIALARQGMSWQTHACLYNIISERLTSLAMLYFRTKPTRELSASLPYPMRRRSLLTVT